MQDVQPVNESQNAPLTLSQADRDAKTQALIAYILMAVGLFFPLTWIISAIWAMVTKSGGAGTIFEDHFKNITTTFWICLPIFLIGLITSFFIIGYLFIIAAWIFGAYKMIKGLARITADKPYRD